MKYFDDSLVNEGTIADLKNEYIYRQQNRSQSNAPKDFLGNPTTSVNPVDPVRTDSGPRMERLTRDGKVLGGTLAAVTALSMLNNARIARKRRKACDYLETQYQKDKCYRELENK